MTVSVGIIDDMNLDNAMTREEYMALSDAELRELRREEYGDVARRPVKPS